VWSRGFHTAESAVREHQQTLEAKRQALHGVENALRADQEALRQAQARAFEAAQQLSRARNEITALDLQKEGNAVRLEKLSAEKIQLEEERVGLKGGCYIFRPPCRRRFPTRRPIAGQWRTGSSVCARFKNS